MKLGHVDKEHLIINRADQRGIIPSRETTLIKIY